MLTGALPRVEGELVIAAIDAFADRLRSTADHIPAAARRADALVELVNTAHATATLPTRGGLPVSLTVTLEHTSAGDPLCTTSRGHLLTAAETRWAGCDAAITPIAIRHPGGATPGTVASTSTSGPMDSTADSAGPTGHPTDPTGTPMGPPGHPVDSTGTATGSTGQPIGSTGGPTPTDRIAALATVMFGAREVLAVGRTQRTATLAQRRALAQRDRGCVIPGCGIPAEACQVHHLTEWADGGTTDIDNLVLVCWAHHRQVDLRMWRIEPSAESPEPPNGAGALPTPDTTWPAQHHAPFTIRRTPRTRWRN